MSFKQHFRTSLSLIVVIGIFLSLFFFGSVLPAQADEGTPPAPDGVIIDPNIVGGAPADPGEWPWQVALISDANPVSTSYYAEQFCGGSLVAPQWVVTAAHCVTNQFGNAVSPNTVDVVAGIYDLSPTTTGYQHRNIIQIVVYPSYNPSTSNNDIALLKLETPVKIPGTGTRPPAVIPLVPSSVGDLTGVNSWVTGWGATESQPNYPTELQEVQVPIVSNADCNSAYPGEITSSMMCAGFVAGGKDSCQGDSGGPLVVDTGNGWQLAGIVSWGQGCADPGFYGVYTRVSVFTSWVNQYIQSAPTGTTLTIRSTGGYDGWVLESGENTGVGGSLNSSNSLFFVGDNAQNKQYRGILSFDTSSIPDNAMIVSVTLRLRYGGAAGTNPFNTHGPLLVDIVTGAFGGNNGLQAGDFEAVSSADGVMTIANSMVKNWFSASLDSGNFGLINLTGLSQLRLRFSLDDNNDNGTDYLKLYSGNAMATYRPQLVIQYTVP